MKIQVIEYPTHFFLNEDSEWECAHADAVIEQCTLGFNSQLEETFEDCYICVECETVLDGSPSEDAYDDWVDMQIMEARGK
jgi:hypothetical protein